MASFAMFPTVFNSKLMNSATEVFAQKKFQKTFFPPEICYRYDQLVTGPRVEQYQGEIV